MLFKFLENIIAYVTNNTKSIKGCIKCINRIKLLGKKIKWGRRKGEGKKGREEGKGKQ